MIGLNINGQGISGENALQDALATGAAMHVVINETKLSAMILAAGRGVIHRMKGPGIQDDDYAYQKHDPVAFVDALHHLAPGGALLYLGNEMGSDELDKQNTWMQRAVARCVALGRKPIVFNNFVYHPTQGAAGWRLLRPAVRDAVAAGGRVGVHIYFDRTAAASLGAFEVLYHIWDVCGADVPISVTEYACAVGLDPYKGPHLAGYASGAAYALAQIDGVQRVEQRNPAAARLVDWQTFIYGKWDKTDSFDVARWRDYTAPLASFNRRPRPPVPPVQPPAPAPSEPPAPETLGEAVPGVVRWTATNNGVNVRSAPALTADVVQVLRAGAAVSFRPQTWTGGGHQWRRLESPAGWVSENVCDVVPRDPAPMIMQLAVPFRSQQGVGASRYGNDCGPACVNMLLQYFWTRAGFREMTGLTVDDLAADSGLTAGDTPQSMASIIALLARYGVTAQARRPFTRADIVRELSSGRPLITLVRYRHLNPSAGVDFGHYVVPTGYSETGVEVHDPLYGGPRLVVPNAQFDLALADLGSAGLPNQSIVVVQG